MKPPEVFNPATLEEEVSQWSDWSFAFKNFLAFMDDEFLADLKKAEASTDALDIEDDIDEFYAANEGRKIRGMKPYSVLSSYLKNQVLRSIDNMDGFEVWRRLTMELEPSSRSRSLAMAQALVGFPAMAKGASLMDYVLTFEKLVNEYEKLSTTKYDGNLKIGTLLKGIPQNLKQHIMVGITEKTSYNDLRTKLLQYERSNQTWSAENILGSLSVQAPGTSSSSKEYQGPIPMEIDRLKGKGKYEKGKVKGKGKGKFDKGKGKGKERKGGRGRSRGKGRGKGRGKSVRQVENGGYGSQGKGSGGKGSRCGVECYKCGKYGHFASECWAPAKGGKDSGKGGKSKGKMRQVREGEEDWSQDHEWVKWRMDCAITGRSLGLAIVTRSHDSWPIENKAHCLSFLATGPE